MKKQKDFFNMTWRIWLKPSYINILCRKLNFHLFMLDCKYLVLFFLCFLAFCEFQRSFYENTFVLTFFTNILLHLPLEGVKIHKIIKRWVSFLPTSNKFAIQINSLVQLRLNFHQIVNKNKLKVWKFSIFSEINKTVTGAEEGKFFLLFLLFLPVHINLQYELNCRNGYFVAGFNLFSTIEDE